MYVRARTATYSDKEEIIITGSLTDRLRHTKFTATQQKIADYFLNNQEKLAGLSSQEAAQEIGVSDASVIRFCRIIGYEGFKDLKSHVYNMLVENSFSGLTLGERMTQSNEKFQRIDPLIQFQSFIHQNMLSVFTNSREDFDRTAEILTSSNHKYIIGLRGCRGLAVSFSRLLTFMLPNVICLNDSEGMSLSRMQDVTDNDAVIMFVFSRYYKTDAKYLELAARNHAKVCLITDGTPEPLQKYTDLTLYVSTAGLSFFHSTIGAAVAAEYILTLIGRKVDYRQRLEERDELTADLRI